ncbi:MAG: ATP-binding cassette domain-containing protein [Clostridiales bacterium]|jgi:ABC-2 type transport system ATP-binding protein|nr:ATP-binding cassette domain-containing protein [Clostridiales bacterium]
MIEVQNLSKRYGSHQAVKNISFRVEEGEILGFLGPNGAGKTTTMNILTGYLSASSGVAKIKDFDVLEQPNQAKMNIGYLPEQPPLYLDMTVREYLDFMYDLKKCKLPRKQHIAEICRLVKIEGVYGRLIKNLSKGYRQRVGFAQALIGNPPVLILDEPTVGLDPKQILEIRSLIKSLGKHHTVILSSHILQEIEAVCDRIIIINNGELVADDTAANLAKKYSNDRRLLVRVAGSQEDVLNTLSRVPGVERIVSQGEKEPGVFEFSIEPEEGADVRREISERIAARNWAIMGMQSKEMTLEEVFIALTREQLGTTKKGGRSK